MTPELRDLCAAAADGRLTPDQARRLEEIVLADPAARRFYVEHLHLHATLTWSAGDPPVTEPAPRPTRRPRWAGWAVAAGLLAAVGLAGWVVLQNRGDRAFATLVDTKACKWDGGTVPTEEGARLSPGRLRLAEGLARIVFDTGAEVRLEGPAELELVGRTRCVLHRGRLVAKVPPPAIGFVVDTPSAELTDLGTEFGVTVRDGSTADVQVFDGLVDGKHRATGATERMATGRNVRFGPHAVGVYDPATDAPPGGRAPTGGRTVTLTTATGRGKDAYVQPVRTPKNQSDILILVKSSVATRSDYFRKGYVGIDLTPLAGARVADAELSFTLAPTGMGFASEVPDATFTVYGLTDEALDGWDEKAVRWETAPANRPGGADLDPAKVRALGQFAVAQGVASGVRSVGGPEVADFLNRDTNGTATFVLVRDTPGSGRNDLVHGFANRHHPTLPPPTLKVTLE